MKCFSIGKVSRVAMLVLFLFVAAGFAFAGGEWREVPPADLQLKTPKVDPNADAEVIFWEVRVDDSNPESLIMKHYIRVKIFTERGREKYSKVDIPFVKGMKIKDILARVVKPDGSIVELAKTDVFDREIAKADKIKVKAKSFAVPNMEVGVIFEYQYQEVTNFGSADDMRMLFQHDVPIQTISYYYKPGADTRILSFNTDAKFVKDKGGFYRATMTDVPAIAAEPYMPPEDEVRSWMLLYYTRRLKDTSTDFWSRLGGNIVYVYDVKDTLKPDKSLKAAVAEITAGSTDPEEQVSKIFDFCKTKIKNLSYDPTMTDEDREKLKPNKSTTDTYKKLQGTTNEVNELFASLTSALGIETRLAFGGDRSEKFFNVNQAHESFIHFASIAVKLGGRWKYFSPGDKFVPKGMLSWNEESTGVLLLGYKDFITTETPDSTPKDSVAKRTGKFTLSEDGTLRGTVKIEYTGNFANEYKTDNYKETANKQEENLKEEIKKTMSTAEISDISIENVSDPEKPFVYNYKIVVPSYAQKTGRRLFLQPGFFTYGSSPVFTTADRKYSVFFHHPWSEEDTIEIALPKGFELENADAPSPLADNSGISSNNITMSINKATNTLIYKRSFVFGNRGYTVFTKENYKPVKGLFDAFHKNDTHMLTVRQVQ